MNFVTDTHAILWWFIKTDYLEIKEKLFGSKTAAEVYNDISKWKMKK